MRHEQDRKHFNLYYIFLEDQKGHPPPTELVQKLRKWLQNHLQQDAQVPP